jgi:biotin carboxyl carrier protein
VPTNRPWLLALLDDERVRSGTHTTQTATSVPTPDVWEGPDRMALAGFVATTLERPPSDDPWEAIGPFRLDGATELAFHGDAGWECVATVERLGKTWQVDLDGQALPLTWHRGAALWMVGLDDEIAPVAIARHADGAVEVSTASGRWVGRAGRRPAEASRAARRGESIVRAPLPGKVLRVDAESGSRVGEGDPLVILSAMKIEVVLRAPLAGRVKAIHCRPDEQVDAGDLLIELEPEEAA